VLPYAPQGLQHHGAGERQEWESNHEALNLPPVLSPTRAGERERVLSLSGGDDLTIGSREDAFGARDAYVYAEQQPVHDAPPGPAEPNPS
jgi:hypothetical protein